MGYFVSALIVGLCLYLVIQPFFTNKKEWRRDEVKDDLDSMTLEQAYATINELEMEFNMGKLPEKDYQSLKAQYERIAASKLKEEAYEGGSPDKTADPEAGEADNTIDDEINRELEEMREKRKGE
ncbi:hypothetical protein K8O68_10345 [Salipaludibacillus sp. CUR1]|uniref:hypothetical protein n=1 Tax=Salipaludibacillus sp. CUR1 TaxID=2820003 RepID=UPI001E57DF0E|nr:hypothetical protein [Salipaludibacillus sp. CUR1]MCE7792814.1 hypothetical protein [Salipaludibacillus sp. CUR1]